MTVLNDVAKTLWEYLLPKVDWRHATIVVMVSSILYSIVNVSIINVLGSSKYVDMPFWPMIGCTLGYAVINALSTGTLWAKLCKLETRFDNLETRFDNLETRFDNLDKKIDDLRVDVNETLGKILKLLGDRLPPGADPSEYNIKTPDPDPFHPEMVPLVADRLETDRQYEVDAREMQQFDMERNRLAEDDVLPLIRYF